MKKLFSIVLALVLITQVSARDVPNKDALLLKAIGGLEQAVESWTIADLQNSRAQLQRLLSGSDKKYLVHYYIAYADYNLTSVYQMEGNEDAMGKTLDDGVDNLEQSIELNDDFAEAHALLSSLLGQKIGLSPMKGIYLGPKSGSIMSQALELDPDNPRVNYLAGLGKYFTPGMFGGSEDEAVALLQKATKQFKTYKPQSELFPTWGEHNAYTWLGIIAAENDSLDLALSYYEKALEIYSGYKWITKKLMPDLNKKMAKKE